MLTSFYPPPVSDVILTGHFLRILSESCGLQRVTYIPFYRPFYRKIHLLSQMCDHAFFSNDQPLRARSTYIVGFECKSVFIPVYIAGYGRTMAALC